ncbi:MAG: (d)CMP kinase [Calditrichaeota bacterium]|nr:(d)CMP kinase [Calditrichota bacterium]
MGSRPIKIAIDGPAASGKSTTARELARRLGYLYIDSGAMYRAVTLKALKEGIPTTDAQKVAQLAETCHIEFRPNDHQTIVLLDGEDVSEQIRSPEVNIHINPVAANPRVREILVKKQQEMGRRGGVVMDGRDIGTVVFPDAELKIYMEATAEERARRRLKELREKGVDIDYDTVYQEILTRDRSDLTRKHGPLRKAPDAIVLDTTHMSIAEQVDKIYQLALQKIRELDP